MSRSPAFTRHTDGRITVDAWTPTIVVSHELLAEPPGGRFVQVDGPHGDLVITVDNGSARYRYVGEHAPRESRFCIVESTPPIASELVE